MRKINFLFAFLLSVMGVTQAWADETLSLTYGADDMVSEHYGTYIPFRGYNADDNFQKSEFILSATELASMNGKLITKMQFQTYESTSSINPTIKFYLQEVSSNEVSTSFTGIETATKVYEGSISVSSDKHMTIAFNEPYLYNGGNLLVTCHLTAKSTVTGAHINFIGGPTSTNAAVFGMSSYSLSYLTSGTINQFLPNITFTYETPAIINQVMLPGDYNGWQGAQNELVYDEASKSYKGVLDLSNTTENQKFKLLVKAEGVANDIWLGWPEKTAGKLTIDAPDGWVYDYSNDNLYLMNSTTDFKTYNITAKWNPSTDASTGWTLKIEGKDDRRNTYTATFTNNNQLWTKVYAYAFTENGSTTTKFLGDWPGTELEQGADGKYTVTIKGYEAPQTIIFNNGNSGEGNQTANFAFEDGGAYENEALVLNTYTATFTNAAGWDNVYAYVWSGDGESATNKALGAWPGTKLTAGTDGKFAVSFEAIEAPEKIIFNNGNNGKQTGNLAFVDGKDYDLFFEGFDYDGNRRVTANDLEGWENDLTEHDEAEGYFGTLQYYNGTVFYYLSKEGDKDAYMITPKLHVESTTDKMVYSAYMNGSGEINVYYSADKNTWTTLSTSPGLSTTEQEINITGIPEGDWYVKFELGNAVINYVYGFTLAPDTKTLALDEAATENQVVAGTYDEVTVAFTMQAGKFAAICLPFATTTTALGEGVKAWAFTGYTDGNIDLSTTTELAAATPYIVYAENRIDGLTFQNVTIESNEAGKVVQGAATFQGSYVKMAADTMTGKYGVTPAGKIQKAGSGASMKAFRAYFDGINQGAKLVFDGEIIGEATGIDTIENAAQAGELYDLQGRRVLNAQKGLYIQNGKKFVVK